MLSFFHTEEGKAPGTGVITNKKPTKKGPARPTQPHGVRSGQQTSSISTPASQLVPGPTSVPRNKTSSDPVSSASSLSRSSAVPRASSQTSSLASSAAPHQPKADGQHRQLLGVRPAPRLGSLSKPKSRSPSVASPLKRKVTGSSRIESESESESDAESASTSVHRDASRRSSAQAEKRKRPGDAGRNTNGTGSSPAAGGAVWTAGRDLWCADEVDERGEFGRGWAGFVGGEEVMRGLNTGWAGGGPAEKGRAGLDKYVPYFPQQGFENAERLPSVDLLYPSGCKEKFILLTPAAKSREYNPMSELRDALRMILEHYIPPTHQHIFGALSSASLDLEAPQPSRIHSPNPYSFTTPPDSSPAPAAATGTIGDALRKALAPNFRKGPDFVKAMERYTSAMGEIQRDGTLKLWLESKEAKEKMGGREWSQLVDRVHEQAYSRVVGPYSHDLEHHPVHPSNVARAISAKEDSYGELRHNFMSRVIEQTGLGPDSVFVDLGSGVGNCVVQVALQAGSSSYGFELLPVPAHCARLQLREVQRRWAMWGLKGNLAIEVHEGDFRTHSEAAKRLREADVVLVNNEVFPPSLNVDLTNLFLDLKEGAQIVSLKPFVPDGFRMNESNCDSFAAILTLAQHSYQRDWVSWKGEAGTYYIQTIDRGMRLKFEQEMLGGRRRH